MKSIVFSMNYPDTNMVGMWPMLYSLYDLLAENLVKHNILSFISFPEVSNPDLEFLNIKKIELDFRNFSPENLPCLSAFIATHEVKVILYVDMPLFYHNGIKMIKKMGVRTINTSRWGFHENENPPMGKVFLKKIARRLVSNQHDHYIAVSSEHYNRLISWEGISKANISLINDAVDVQKYFPGRKPQPGEIGLPEKKNYIVSIAQCREEKRIDFLIEIASELFACNPELSLAFVHVGDGKLLSLLKEKVNRMGLADKYFFVGHQKQVLPYLNICDIFIHTSERESFGGATAEAMACGKPVVISNVGEADYFVREGQNGFKLYPTDKSGFIGKILYLLENPGQRKIFGDKSREIIVKNYNRIRQVQLFSDLILHQFNMPLNL